MNFVITKKQKAAYAKEQSKAENTLIERICSDANKEGRLYMTMDRFLSGEELTYLSKAGWELHTIVGVDGFGFRTVLKKEAKE